MTQRKVGKYEIRDELGRGAMGIVYKAYDTLLSREVALKIMIHAEQGSSEHKRRFYREAQSAGSLMHDNIVKVFDLGEDAGLPYIVMEYLPGEDLKEQMVAGKLLNYRDILKIWLQICNGLHHAHRRGLVHRDIKPGNIRITTGGRVKIMDFGIAKKPSSDLTQSGVVLGTVDYMAPEQVKGLGADARSDLFALGVMFYEMLTLRKPFPGDSVTSVIYKIVYEEPEPFEPLRVTCPPDVHAIVRKLMTKDPNQRYASALDVARDLKASYTAWKDGVTQGHAALMPSLEMTSPETLPPTSLLPTRPAPPPPPDEATVISGGTGEDRTALYDRGSQRTTPPPPVYAPPSAVRGPLPAETLVASNAARPPAAPAYAPPPPSPPVASRTLATVVAAPPAPPTPPPYVPPVEPDVFATIAGPAPPPRQLSIDDLPMRPFEEAHAFQAAPSPAVAQRAAAPAARTSPRSAPTLVDAELPPEAMAPRARLPIFWISMVLLFLAVVVGGAIVAKQQAGKADPGPVASTPPPTETPVETPQEAPRPARGKLRIETNVPAEVRVDGNASGTLPSDVPLELTAGKHQVLLKDSAFGVTVTGEIEVTAGGEAVLKLPFEGDGQVQLRVRPWANVVINGDHARAVEVQAAHRPLPLPAGKHTFEFQQMGKKTTREAYVVPGKTTEIDVNMNEL